MFLLRSRHKISELGVPVYKDPAYDVALVLLSFCAVANVEELLSPQETGQGGKVAVAVTSRRSKVLIEWMECPASLGSTGP